MSCISTLTPPAGCHHHVLVLSGKRRMFDVVQETLESDFPAWLSQVFSYVSIPGLLLPLMLLMV